MHELIGLPFSNSWRIVCSPDSQHSTRPKVSLHIMRLNRRRFRSRKNTYRPFLFRRSTPSLQAPPLILVLLSFAGSVRSHRAAEHRSTTAPDLTCSNIHLSELLSFPQ